MANSDRRSGQDRRMHQRRNVSIDVEWESSDHRRTGTLSDLSQTGCFVLCSGDVETGERVKLFLPLGDGMKVQVQGDVRNRVLEIGFALRFIDLTEAQTDVINGLMVKYGEYLSF